MRRLDPKASAILVISGKEKLAAAMPAVQMKQLTRATAVLLEAAFALGSRVIATEQYPAGLGRTLAPIAERLAGSSAPVIEKVEFSACDCGDFERAFAA